MEERNNSRQQSHRAARKRRVEKQMQEDADGKGRRAVTELQALFLDFFGLDSMKTLVIWPGYSNPKGKLHKPSDLLCVCFLPCHKLLSFRGFMRFRIRDESHPGKAQGDGRSSFADMKAELLSNSWEGCYVRAPKCKGQDNFSEYIVGQTLAKCQGKGLEESVCEKPEKS